MSDFTINFFGWCNEGGHDKVWGFVTTEGGTLYNFWGKRGKALTFRRIDGADWGDSKIRTKAKSKMGKHRSSGSYQEVPVDQIEIVSPGFTKEFSPQLVTAILFGKLYDDRE